MRRYAFVSEKFYVDFRFLTLGAVGTRKEAHPIGKPPDRELGVR